MQESASQKCASLCGCRLGVAVGIVWGLGMFIAGVASIYGSYGWKLVDVMSSVYWGVVPGTWRGAWLGLVYGFFDGLIGTAIIVGLYNLMMRCGSCCCSCCRPKEPVPPSQT